MDGDVSSSHIVIKHVASESGLPFIKDVVERHVRIAERTGPSLTFWTTEIKPLFQLITHPRVIDSAVLEQEVATIFNYVSGLGGRRMKYLFGHLVKLVQAWPDTDDKTDSTMMSAVELSLAVLTKMLDCNTVNIVNEAFVHLNTQFAEVVSESTDDQESFARLQSMKYIDYILRRLEVGDEIVTYQDLPTEPVIRENFVLRRDLPGALSAEGPRHDNDFADISKISILPTCEEIMSPRAEYLPTNDSSTWHVGGIRGRIDREFRLLREDTVGQLRDTVRHVQEQMRKPQEDRLTTRNNLRTYTYEDPTPINVMFGRDGGLELLVQCQQLTAVNSLKAKDREAWWQQSRRMQTGALVCLIDASENVGFFVVSQSTLRSKEDEKSRRQTSKAEKPEDGQSKPTYTLSDDSEFLYVILQLVESNAEEVQRLLEWYRAIGATERKFLVEFPGILLDSFKHTLTALQDIYKKPNVPFSDLIAPSSEKKTDVLVQPPLFARRPGFNYKAHCLRKGLIISAVGDTEPGELVACSTLDHSQSSAILNTLSRELSLVQGPPGTGKSYTGEMIIQILLQNKKQAHLGPILCVCYTNHALDQLLEHLLDKGVEKVIRIGSRSKSERMINLNLKNIVKAFDKTKSEKAELGQAHGEIKRVTQEIVSGLRELAASQATTTIKKYLQSHHPRHHNELFPPSEDGWTRVSYQTPASAFDKWLTSGHEDSFKHKPVEDLELANLCEMSSYERRFLFENWLREIRDPIICSVVALQREYAALFERRDRVGGDVKLRCLQEADVIGVTTTGLAKNIGLLRRLRSKIMLCEEAGEVLEAHVLTALLPSLEQAILIGDHLQLRPQINNYELQSTSTEGSKYSLDVSLFERLVQPLYDTDPRVPYSTLETQRRMHPSIASLIRSTLYPSLNDSELVNSYPEVKGVKQRLFWLHHEHFESGASAHDPLSTSHSNDFEVEMTTALVSHLIRQGEYQNGRIAVLTPYLGQLHKLRRRMSSIVEICLNDRDNEDLEAMMTDLSPVPQTYPVNVSKSSLLKTIRVATIDNFQGEEADVVVISLVRSNPQSRCGFLSTKNRINVLLSRAKHGMYIIGNSNTYRSVPMWQDVIEQLDAQENIGTKLGLQCPRHPETPILVSEPDDFAVHAPESGCNLPCQMRLRCGHSCTGRCHSEVLHEAVKCIEPCPRSLESCDHSCPERCGDVCPSRCQKLVKGLDMTLECGHRVKQAPCFQVQDPSLIQCSVTVRKVVPGCEHHISIACCEDVTDEKYKCEAAYKSAAGNIRRVVTFAPKLVTTGPAALLVVSLARSGAVTHDAVNYAMSLVHHVPKRSAILAALTLNAQCLALYLATGFHAPSVATKPSSADTGPSICGETCPDSTFCQECASDEIKSTCVDFLEMKEYRDIDLDHDPCIFPDCGHFLTIASMDGQMDMPSHYEMGSNGCPAGINKASEPFSMDGAGVCVCAKCRGSLRNIARYGRIVRRATLDEATKKFISWSSTKYLALASRLFDAESTLNKAADLAVAVSSAKPKRPHFTVPRFSYLGFLERGAKMERYGSLMQCWKDINTFANQVKKEEQPFQRVADFVRHINRQRNTRKGFRFDNSVLQVKGFLLASLLRLRCEICIMSDFFNRTKGPAAGLPLDLVLDLTEQFKDCEQVTRLAQESMYPKEEVQALIYKAHLSAIGSSLVAPVEGAESDSDGGDSLKQHGYKCLGQARGLLDKYPSTRVFEGEIDSLQRTLDDGSNKSATQEELRAVFQAMSGELGGSGHWYACENGHYFTIGECGRPMEEARCPDCDARIGGRNHSMAEGVTAAEDMEELGRGIDGLVF
ncbi:hypothetical protein EsDP_00006437 [Epichloe bromicola]|uniref:RZ-type domain-containing protein n=1 Tax=Epichloe bromicola TaxID=79588 RepID=A0ABQ0CXP9_9HYPO